MKHIIKIQIIFFVTLCISNISLAQYTDVLFHFDKHRSSEHDIAKFDSLSNISDSIYKKMPPPRFLYNNDLELIDVAPTLDYDPKKFNYYFRLYGPDSLNNIKREIYCNSFAKAFQPSGVVKYSNYKTNEILLIIEVYNDRYNNEYKFYYFNKNKLIKIKIYTDVLIYNSGIIQTKQYLDSIKYVSGYIDENAFTQMILAYYNNRNLFLVNFGSNNKMIHFNISKKYFQFIDTYMKIKQVPIKNKQFTSKRDIKRYEKKLIREGYFKSK